VGASLVGPDRRQAVFVDPISCHLLALAQRVSQAEVTTLLVGPTGAGKEVLARLLHEASPRRNGPFVAVNCAALPEQLIESQLFGHEKGAFTGAWRSQAGLLEQADGGTLFLDEIGDMPLALQAKLLRVLQEREVQRLGASRAQSIDVRLVAATNQDLRQAMERRAFREDLYYRIATFRLRVPALAERPGDILPLAAHCLARRAPPGGGQWRLSPAARQQLLAYAWPGNVRELENVLSRAMVLSLDGAIDTPQLLFDDAPDLPSGAWGLPTAVWPPAPHSPVPPPQAEGWAAPTTEGAPGPGADLQQAQREHEHRMIQSVLASTRNRSEAAQRLGISPRTLRYKLAQWRSQGPVTAREEGTA
jgi:two-component system, response regulator FlrC